MNIVFDINLKRIILIFLTGFVAKIIDLHSRVIWTLKIRRENPLPEQKMISRIYLPGHKDNFQN